jgi:hypothetical protein
MMWERNILWEMCEIIIWMQEEMPAVPRSMRYICD